MVELNFCNQRVFVHFQPKKNDNPLHSSRSRKLEWSILPFPDPQSPLLGRVTQKEAHSPGSRSAYPGMCRKEPSSLLEPQSVSARSASLEQNFLRSNKECHMFLTKNKYRMDFKT